MVLDLSLEDGVCNSGGNCVARKCTKFGGLVPNCEGGFTYGRLVETLVRLLLQWFGLETILRLSETSFTTYQVG